MTQLYYTVDSNREVSQVGLKAIIRGGVAHVPINALLIAPLPYKKGFTVVVNSDFSGTEYMLDHRGKTIYNTADVKQSQTVDTLGEIESGWTLQVPGSTTDKWLNEAWVSQTSTAMSVDNVAQNNLKKPRLYSAMSAGLKKILRQ